MEKTARNRLHIAIFVFCITCAVCVVTPVYRKIASAITDTTRTFQAQIEEMSGLAISYERISPSILNSIRISGIKVRNAADGNEMISVRAVSLRYSFINLLKRDWQNLFSTLVINGVEVDFNSENDMKVVRRLMSLFSRQDAAEENEAETKESSGKSFDPESFSARIPVTVLVRNAVFYFSNKDFDANASVRRASFAFNEATQDLKVVFSSTLNARLIKQNLNFSTSVSADGTLTDALKNSLLLLHLSNLRAEQFSVDAVSVLASYYDRNVILRSVQNFVPVSLVASYNIDSKTATVNAQAEELKPFSVVSLRTRGSELFDRLKDVVYTGALSVSYDTGGDNSLAYVSSGKILAPADVVPGGGVVSYNVDGGRDRLNVSAFDFLGERYDASFKGSYKFDLLQLDGSAFVRHVTLPNGNAVSGDFYFTPRSRGFECFSPQINFGEKSLNAFEMTLSPRNGSIDFNASISDYTHYDSGLPGVISLDGTYITSDKFFQTSVSVSSVYLDGAAQVAAAFMKRDSAAKAVSASSSLSPYVVSSELYVAGDLNNITYNVPYFFAADTRKENRAMLLSLDGTNSLVRVSRMNLLYAGQSVTLSGQADFNKDFSGGFFSADVIAGTIPYHFSGSVFSGGVNVSGDYGFSLQAKMGGDGMLSGSLVADLFPVPVSKLVLMLSSDADFTYSAADGINVSIPRFEVSESGTVLQFAPRVLLAGNVSRYGAFFDYISYSDRYSSLDGSVSLLLNMNDDVFSSATFDMDLSNPLGVESVSIKADVANPDMSPLSSGAWRENLYFNGQAVVNRLGISRFIGEVNDNNLASCVMTATGTVSDPFVSLSVDEVTGVVSGTNFSVECMATVEEQVLAVHDMNFRYGSFNMKNFTSSIALETLTGDASAFVEVSAFGRSVTAPVALVVSETETGDRPFIPQSGIVTVSSSGVGGSLLAGEYPVEISMLYGGGTAMVTTSENIGLSGWIDTSGALSFSIPENYPLSFVLSGNVSKKNINVSVENVVGDAAKVISLLSYDTFKVKNGIVTGSFMIRGLLADPEFDGVLLGESVVVSLSNILMHDINVASAILLMDHNTFTMPQAAGFIHKSPVSGTASIVLDRWHLDYVTLNAWTERNVYVPVNFVIPTARFRGEASTEISLLYQEGTLGVSGDVYVKNTNGVINGMEMAGIVQTPRTVDENAISVQSDVRVFIGDHVNILFNPLLRCVLVPGSDIKIIVDQVTDTYFAVGDVRIRSGEVAWLNRNFYLRSGSLRFLDNIDKLDPLVTVNAETRERDSMGRDVRITLSVENQFLSNFTPRISSIPAKSELEIQELLGQIAVGDSATVGDLFYAAGDYAFQSTVGRAFENSLRELLNFDIFSIRTNFVQNTLRQSFSGRFNNTSDWALGNFFDNSTVYIGKYINSDMFFDARFNWRYDNLRVNDETTLGGIIFQPEVGLELESPYVTIRWGAAPNLDALMNNTFIPSTSLTLSWKFSF